MKKQIQRYAGVLLASAVMIAGVASAAITPAFPTISNNFAVAGQMIKSADINKLSEAVNNLDKRAFQAGTDSISFLKSDGSARTAGQEFTINDNGMVGIGTTEPKTILDIKNSKYNYNPIKQQEQYPTDGTPFCFFDTTGGSDVAPYIKDPVGYECWDSNNDPLLNSGNTYQNYLKKKVSENFWNSINYTSDAAEKVGISNCSWDTLGGNGEYPTPNNIPNDSQIGHKCYDMLSATGFNIYEAQKIESTQIFTIKNNGQATIGSLGNDTAEKNSLKPYANLNVANNISVQGYSPMITLQRNVNYGGFVQGIQTKLMDGTDGWWNGTLSNTSFGVVKGSYTSSTGLIIADTGNATLSGTLTQSSDETLKKDIIPLANSLEKLQNITPVSYTWKDATRGTDTNIGLIAQDIEKQFPQLVYTDENGLKSVAYANLVAPLIDSVKELKKENDDLKKRLEAIEAKVQ